MGRIPDEIIQQVRDRVDLVELVGRSVSLKRAGRSYKGLCPFHGEKTPVLPRQSRPRQLLLLRLSGGRRRVRVRDEGREPHLRRGRPQPRDATAASRSPRRAAARAAVSEAAFAANEIAQAHLPRRVRRARQPRGGLSRQARAQHPRTPSGSRSASRPTAGTRWRARSQRSGVPASVGEKAGLLGAARARRRPLRPAARSPHVPDPRRARPHHRLRRSRARAGPGAEVPEHARERDLPQARGVLRLVRGARGDPQRRARRGRRGLLRPHRARACAGSTRRSPPAAPRSAEDHARNLRRRTRNVVLLFDGDEAGQRAMERSLEVLLPAGLRVRAALLPAGQDPDDLLAREGAEALRAIVDRAPAALDFAIDRAVARGCAIAGREGRRGGRGGAAARAGPLRRRALGLRAAARALGRHRGAPRRGRDPRRERGEDARDAVPIPVRHERPRGAQDPAARAQPGRSSRPGGPRFARRRARARAGRPAARADRGAGRRRPRRTAPSRSRSWRGGSARTRRRLLRQHLRCRRGARPAAAERTIDDTIRWLRKEQLTERLRALTRSLRDPDADVQAILEEKERLTKQRFAATHHR